MPKILVIDDEGGIRESLCYALERDGFEAVPIERIAGIEGQLPGADLLVLDLMLPDGSGLDFLKRLRVTSAVPVIVLTSRAEEVDRVVGLELGADDYVTKPFSPREVVARVRAVLRRPQAVVSGQSAQVGPVSVVDSNALRVDGDARRAYVGACEMELSRLEFDLLSLFVKTPDRAFDRGHLLQRVWGDDCHVTERTVDVHINGLRRKIKLAGGDELVIETVRGVGYRLRGEPA